MIRSYSYANINMYFKNCCSIDLSNCCGTRTQHKEVDCRNHGMFMGVLLVVDNTTIPTSIIIYCIHFITWHTMQPILLPSSN